MQQSLFQEHEYQHPKLYYFKNTELGRIHATIPWDLLEACLPEEDETKPGPSQLLSNAGVFGMMFLKHILDVSDEKLLERFNTDWSCQLFCGKLFEDDQKIRNTGFVSILRSHIAENADLMRIQDILLNHWKSDLSMTQALFMDATCYESYIRFPTDVKLLWESCEWVYEKLLFKFCGLLNQKRPRNKFIDQKKKYLSYARLRKKGYKRTRKRHKSLVYLLEKGIGQLQQLLNSSPNLTLTKRQSSYIRTIKQVLSQQIQLQANPLAKIQDRIVSLHKPYLRPIVRGKENKAVEFGMKAHMLQTDGVTWFDTMDFKAFNECKRLKISYIKHKIAFGGCHQIGADRIYATNENRRYLTEKQVVTNFAQKGKAKKDTQAKSLKILKAELNKIRSTVLEGAFGNHKNHYGLRKIKALTEGNERVWAFFGVMSSNASLIAKRRLKKVKQKSEEIPLAA